MPILGFMGHIHLPITDYLITYRFYIGNQEKLETFKNISGLRAYFHRHPYRGALVGYGKAKPLLESDHAIKDARILLYFKDKLSTVHKEFSHVNEFVLFLKDHPELGEVVGYKPKA